MGHDFLQVAQQMADIGRRLDARGWVTGTSGNVSAVLDDEPLRLAITPSGASKGEMTPESILEIDAMGAIIKGGPGKPSAETSLHLEIIRLRKAGAVLHTHSVWSTLISSWHANRGG